MERAEAAEAAAAVAPEAVAEVAEPKAAERSSVVLGPNEIPAADRNHS